MSTRSAEGTPKSINLKHTSFPNCGIFKTFKLVLQPREENGFKNKMASGHVTWSKYLPRHLDLVVVFPKRAGNYRFPDLSWKRKQNANFKLIRQMELKLDITRTLDVACCWQQHAIAASKLLKKIPTSACNMTSLITTSNDIVGCRFRTKFFLGKLLPNLRSVIHTLVNLMKFTQFLECRASWQK